VKISSCSVIADQKPVSAVSRLPCEFQRGREKESPGRGQEVPLRAWGWGAQWGTAAGLGVHPQRRLLSCHRSPKPIEGVGEPRRGYGPHKSTCSSLAVGKAGDRRVFRALPKPAASSAGREGRREDSGCPPGSLLTSASAARC